MSGCLFFVVHSMRSKPHAARINAPLPCRLPFECIETCTALSLHASIEPNNRCLESTFRKWPYLNGPLDPVVYLSACLTLDTTYVSVTRSDFYTAELGRVHTDNFTGRAHRSRTVRGGLPVYTLRPLRRVRPVHSDHIRRCSQWTRTVRGGLALQCERSSGRVGRVG